MTASCACAMSGRYDPHQPTRVLCDVRPAPPYKVSTRIAGSSIRTLVGRRKPAPTQCAGTHAVCGTEISHGYAMCGTDIVYGATTETPELCKEAKQIDMYPDPYTLNAKP
eukprot:3941886-Rhodomonas_salina.3